MHTLLNPHKDLNFMLFRVSVLFDCEPNTFAPHGFIQAWLITFLKYTEELITMPACCGRVLQ